YISIGLVANMILDPLFILTFNMGVTGAAVATLIGSLLPFILFTITLIRKTNIFNNFKYKLDGKITKKVSRISTPVAFQNCIFTLIAMFISMLVVKYGNEAIAAQRIGNQLESFSWMISLAISASIGAFVGQNYGAKFFQRISRGTFLICVLMSIYGLMVTYVFLFKSENLFSIFSNDLGVIEIGYRYLLIVAFSQIFIIYEGIASGVFNAIGLTRIPVFFSLTGNIARIPLALLFSSLYGIDGIWFALSLTAIYKGLGAFLALIIYFVKNNDYKLKYFFTKI
ncbi:MAG: MATE family efflux transporter, partial [Mycoplasmatales bacterium]